jgi:hypothetical protein
MSTQYDPDQVQRAAEEAARQKVNGPDAAPFDYRQHMTSVQKLLDHPPAPIQFLLDGLVAKGACSLLIGKPKSFKSTLAMQIALALCGNPALLADWAEFRLASSKRYRVAIIDYEQSDAIAHGLIARFGVKKVRGMKRLGNKFPKMDEAGVAALRRLIVGEKLDLVIMDSLVRMMPGQDKPTSVFQHEGKVMQRLTELAHETGCHIMVIAHAGKRDAADDPMQMIAGTNALPASVDDVLVLFKDQDSDDTGGAKARKLFVNGRHIAKSGTYVLEKLDQQPCFVLKGEEAVFVRGATCKKLMELLGGAEDALTVSDLAQLLSRNRGTIHKALGGLIKDRLVVKLKGKYTTRASQAAAAVERARDGVVVPFRKP